MSKTKRILSLITRSVLCFLGCALIWNFVINLLTAAAPERRITLYVSIDADRLKDRELSHALEADLPEGIRMVRAHPFSYLLLDSAAFGQGDLYVLPEEEASALADRFCPLPEAFRDRPDILSFDGVPCGLRVWDGASGQGCAEEYIDYGAGAGDWYLFFGDGSLHVPGNPDAADGAALNVAAAFLETE